jgi:thymidine kinase
MDFASTRGSIHLITGCMFSGKTSHLIQLTQKFVIAGKSAVFVKYAGDTRYQPNAMCTHDYYHVPALPAKNVSEVYLKVRHYDVVAIDEAQFLSDISIYAEILANQGKQVLLAALDGDYLRRPFTAVVPLYALADRVEKLQAVCQKCGQLASFSHRKTTEAKQHVIGGLETYQAVCRKCYWQATGHNAGTWSF